MSRVINQSRNAMDRPRIDRANAWPASPDATFPASPKLLVSVRDRDEMELAITTGADIVDFKEPRRGPLAPTDRLVWQHAASRWDRFAPMDGKPLLSAALGEREEAASIAGDLPSAFAFAKVGPSGCADLAQVCELWNGIRRLLDPSIELVAVAYADWHVAGCPQPESLFDLARDQGFRRILIDTYRKDGRSTVDHLGGGGLMDLGQIARRQRLWWALAGSITVSCAETLAGRGLIPDSYGVRGDVCRRGRGGELCADRIRRWKHSLAEISGAVHSTTDHSAQSSPVI